MDIDKELEIHRKFLEEREKIHRECEREAAWLSVVISFIASVIVVNLIEWLF